MISSFEPPTHYSRYLTEALARSQTNWRLIAIVEQGASSAPPGVLLRPVWRRGARSFFDVLREVLAKRPHVVHVQHELTMYGGSFSAGLFPFFLAMLRLFRLPVVTTVHAIVPPWEVDETFMRTFALGGSGWKTTAARLLLRVIYRSIGMLSHAVIAHAPSMRSVLVKGYGIPDHRIRTLPIGISVAATSKPNEPCNEAWWLPELRDSPFLLFFGYLVRRKGLEYLIEAFDQFAAENPHYYLVIAGGVLDYQRDYADQITRQANASFAARRIIFPGFVDLEPLQWLYTQCRLVVLPYAYSISSSLPLSLAFQHGKPVLATELSSMLDEVQHGVNGWLVPARSVQALRSGMKRLAEDEGLLASLAVGADATARDRSWDRFAERTLAIYDAVLDEGAKH